MQTHERTSSITLGTYSPARHGGLSNSNTCQALLDPCEEVLPHFTASCRQCLVLLLPIATSSPASLLLRLLRLATTATFLNGQYLIRWLQQGERDLVGFMSSTLGISRKSQIYFCFGTSFSYVSNVGGLGDLYLPALERQAAAVAAASSFFITSVD